MRLSIFLITVCIPTVFSGTNGTKVKLEDQAVTQQIFISELIKSQNLRDDVELFNGYYRRVSLDGYYLVFYPRPTLNHVTGIPFTMKQNVTSLAGLRIGPRRYASLRGLMKMGRFEFHEDGFAVALYREHNYGSPTAKSFEYTEVTADVDADLIDVVYYGKPGTNYLNDVLHFNRYMGSLARHVTRMPDHGSISRCDFDSIKNPFSFDYTANSTLRRENKCNQLEVRLWATGRIGIRADDVNVNLDGLVRRKGNWRSASGVFINRSTKSLYIAVNAPLITPEFKHRALIAYLSNGAHTSRSSTRCTPIPRGQAIDLSSYPAWKRARIVYAYGRESIPTLLGNEYEFFPPNQFIWSSNRDRKIVCRLDVQIRA